MAPAGFFTSITADQPEGFLAPHQFREPKGPNRVGVRVKENYGGWACTTELADPAALSGPAAEGR